jgi:hypothetical protein
MSSRLSVVMLVLLAIVPACTSSSDTPESTTAAPISTLEPTTTLVQASSTTTTTLAPISQITPPSYQIVTRIPTDAGGDEVVVLLDPTSYDTISDLDVHDIIAEVVELFPPVTVMHVVDDPVAANVVADPEATDEAKLAVADHYLARLDSGFRITFLGPLVESGSAVLGS